MAVLKILKHKKETELENVSSWCHEGNGLVIMLKTDRTLLEYARLLHGNDAIVASGAFPSEKTYDGYQVVKAIELFDDGNTLIKLAKE